MIEYTEEESAKFLEGEKGRVLRADELEAGV